MAIVIDQEVMMSTAAEMSQNKLFQDDDAASTASGASSDQVSLPPSPGASEMASLPSSPSQVFPDAALVTPEGLANLPSLGSLGHFAGLCSRCCFHAKGRCQNGHDCRFCHFEHEKRQRKKKVVGKYVDGSCNVSFPGPVAPKAPAPASPVVPCSPPPGLELIPFEAMSVPLHLSPTTAPAPAILGLPNTTPSFALPQKHQQPDLESWSVEMVVDWLSASGLGHLSKCFEEHRITGDVLCSLDSADLEEIGVHAFGDKKRILKGITQLQSQEQSVQPAQSAHQRFLSPPPPPSWEAPSFEAPQPSWEAPSFEAHSFSACPPTAPPSFVEFHQSPPPGPPSFDAPM